MKQAMYATVGVMLILVLAPVVVGAIAVAAMVIPWYGVEPDFARFILFVCGSTGFFSLAMCIVGVQLVRKSVREPRDGKRAQ